jgi:hypothetical protein
MTETNRRAADLKRPTHVPTLAEPDAPVSTIIVEGNFPPPPGSQFNLFHNHTIFANIALDGSITCDWNLTRDTARLPLVEFVNGKAVALPANGSYVFAAARFMIWAFQQGYTIGREREREQAKPANEQYIEARQAGYAEGHKAGFDEALLRMEDGLRQDYPGNPDPITVEELAILAKLGGYQPPDSSSS